MKLVVLVLDNGPVHTSTASAAAHAARTWITVAWLPRYVPGLNDIERSWRDLKRLHLAHRTFRDVTEFDVATQAAVTELNKERFVTHSCDQPAIAAQVRSQTAAAACSPSVIVSLPGSLLLRGSNMARRPPGNPKRNISGFAGTLNSDRKFSGRLLRDHIVAESTLCLVGRSQWRPARSVHWPG